MKFTLSTLLLSTLSGVYGAITVPKGTDLAFINLSKSGELRIYHQDNLSNVGIKEITTRVPTSPVLNDGYIFTGETRANTPLAALTWYTGNNLDIRVYYITPSNTLGEVSYLPGKGWNAGGSLGFPILAGSQALYASKVDSFLIVGYTNDAGTLSEAYYDLNNPGWKTYVL